MNDLPNELKEPLATLLLAAADDKLMLGHRNSDWTGLAPILEEDIAFSSIAQDEIAHAQALYELTGQLLDRSANELAFGRGPEAYRCACIVEVPDEFDWATAIARQFFCDHYDMLRLGRMADSSWKPLASLATRLAAEEHIHVDHVDGWILRLGCGTDESRQRLQAALDRLSPIAGWLMEPFEGLKQLVDSGIYPGGDFETFDLWKAALADVTDRAGLTLTLEVGSPDEMGGRRGVHTEHLEPMLDEMCEVYRLEPGAAW